MTIFYNDQKPWWKTKRPLFFIPSNSEWFLDLSSHGLWIEMDKLFCRMEGKKNLEPLKNHCLYREIN